MADEELRLELSAQVDKFAADIRKATEELNRMYHQGESVDDIVQKMDSRFTRISGGMRDYSTSAKTAGTATQNVAVNANKLNESTQQMASNLPRLRYALYDVSTAFAVTGAAILGVSVAAAATAITMDRQFADVRRTTDAAGLAARDLREDFNDLFTSIPTKWEALTQIGTLAGQLNIATTDVAEFTELVAKFSATTDVSVEQSATAFGRLSQLLGVASEDYSRLGSSILNVGVNSVATESQIISISTQIAGIARQANLSADEVFGLSASIASLGIQPELARGTITRLFTQIEVAISGGGDALDRFAAISGRTASEFRSAWGNQTSEVIVDLLGGLGGIAERGGSAAAALRELGITSVRDVPALLRLAQSSDMVAEALALSAQGWEENAALQDQFGVIADTVGAKIEVIVNKFNKLVDFLGSSAAGAHVIVDAISGLLDIFNALAQSPVISTFAGIALVVGTVAGAFSLFIGLGARVAATFLALRTAQLELTGGTGTLSAAVSAFTGVMTGNTAAITANTAAKTGNTAATAGMAGAHSAGAASTSKFSSALGRGGLVGSILLAIPLMAELTNLTALWASSGVASFLGVTRETEKYQTILQSLKGELAGFDLEITRILDGLAAYGGEFGFGDFLATGIGGSTQFQILEEEIRKIDEAMAGLAEAGDAAFVTVQLDNYIQRLIEAGVEADVAEGFFQRTFDALANGDLVLQQAADSVDAYVEGLEASLESILGVVDENNKLQVSLDNLAQSFLDNGAIATGSSNEMLAAIRQVFALDPSNAANNLNALFQVIIRGGYASAEQLGILRQAIASLGGVTGAATVDFSGFGVGITRTVTRPVRQAASAAREAREEIRTLVDYASDLRSVMGRAFDIRFGSQDALDQVTSRWQDLNREMEDYKQRVRELTADRNVTRYFLRVAETYDDTLRAGVLRAELGKIDRELADAQSGVSKELQGTSQAAIRNRSTVTDLVRGYQDYITQLAESGASQTELNRAVERSRTEFMEQARALGFSTQELQPYIQSFRDMRVVIERVPRNITVSANTDPAMQALAEYEAKLKSISGKTYPGPTITNPTNSKDVRRAALEAEIAARSEWVNHLRRSGNYSGMMAALNSLDILRNRLLLHQYKEGGYTGNGGKSAPAGVVHGKEFVFTAEATKNAGVGNLYGMMRAFEQGRGYQQGGYVAPRAITPRSSGPNVFILDQAQYQGLINSGNVVVKLGDETVTNHVNRTNTQYANLGRG